MKTRGKRHRPPRADCTTNDTWCLPSTKQLQNYKQGPSRNQQQTLEAFLPHRFWRWEDDAEDEGHVAGGAVAVASKQLNGDSWVKVVALLTALVAQLERKLVGKRQR